MNARFEWMLLLAAAGAADAATFTVTTTADVGAGSLRQAILSANATSTPDTIAFNIPQAGVVTIALQSALPALSQPLVIDGLSQSGGSGPPLVRIDGNPAVSSGVGLHLTAPGCSTAICAVTGLQIAGFGIGIYVQSNNWSIRRNYIGNNGNSALANGNGILVGATSGVIVGGPATERNLISGNSVSGIDVGAGAASLLIHGNYIGLDAAGTGALANARGIRVQASLGPIDIGGLNQSEGNVISGNVQYGVELDSDSSNVRVRANRIGTNGTGTAALANGSGVRLAGGGHQVGGNGIAARNQISGNTQYGVLIGDLTGAVVIAGNHIGTSSNGTAAMANGAGGIRVAGAGAALTIGGATAGDGNLISGNGQSGITLDAASNAVSILGNRIGTRADGNAALPNQGSGVSLSGSNHLLGGASATARNQISGNGADGVAIVASASGVGVLGNYIGTNANGSAALANGGSGIRVLSGTPGIRIGDAGAGEGNLISGNASRGIALDGTSNGVLIRGNRIGTSADGNAALGNGETGILLNGNDHYIGGVGAGQGNLISGNAGSGITSSSGGGSSIQGNYIGTRADGNAALANTVYGIRVVQTDSLGIGGATAGAGNLISGNVRGVSIEPLASQVRVAGNILGLNAAGNAPVPNGSGADTISVSGPDATIGGPAPGAGNIIAGNPSTAIGVRLASATNAKIQGNWIGTNPALAPGLGNHGAGILVDRADGVLIGGTQPGAGNVIANQDFYGILIDNGTRNSVLGNAIFGNAPQQLDIADQGPEINDPLDPDNGANFRQNFPVIRSALYAAGSVSLTATLASKPAQSYRIEFFQAAACGVSGLGGANQLLGAQMINTDAGGNATATLSLPAASGTGVVTAIATAADGSSSEFSPCHELSGPNPGRFQVWRSPLLGYEGLPTMKVTVVRTHGNQGTASVHLATVDASATAPADYQAQNLDLVFADGEVLRSIEVPIAIDALAEGSEQFLVQLSAPTGGATLGSLATATALIIENPVPFYAVGDGAVVEPASGMASIDFTITLSPTSTPISLDYFTEDASAIAGEDYVATSGTLDYPASPAIQTRTISVPVLADALGEGQELFYLRANSTAGNIAVYDGTGEGTIFPPGSAPPDELFRNGFE